jgi:glycosyltransferase involved in cell wall biosynthesis
VTRIAVDARPAAFPKKTGIGYYTWHLLRLLPEVDPGTSYVGWYLDAGALMGRPSPRPIDHPPSNLRLRRTPIPAQWFERSSERFDLPRVEWFARFDVLFAPNFIPPPTRTGRLVVTVHDLAFRLFPDSAPHGTRRWLERLDRALARASRVIAVSQTTRHDLIRLYGVREEVVAVVPHGVDHRVFRPAPPESIEQTMRRFGVDGPYLLSLGGLEPRKNLPSLIRAFARMPPDPDPTLVIAGARTAWNPQGWDSLRSALAELPEGIRRRVILTGYLSEQEKVALLSGALALCYPSTYEGFGLPVLEAMACGTPVITSNVSALPEVAGDAALLVDPDDVGAIASAMDRIVGDPTLREDLRKAGLARAGEFDWLTTARRTAEVLHLA